MNARKRIAELRELWTVAVDECDMSYMQDRNADMTALLTLAEAAVELADANTVYMTAFGRGEALHAGTVKRKCADRMKSAVAALGDGEDAT